MTPISARMLRRRLAVASAASSVVFEGRRVELAAIPAVARVAILAEAAGALAALARKQALLSHVDANQVAQLVTDPVDARAVLGRGRWTPLMCRPVLAVPVRNTRRAASRSAAVSAVQPSLFSPMDEGR
ncbi:hypothetical protein [Allorhizocola rhizosphaerae]|uniref:hypothetical protein n=1 Tax=Allorhizocola rhizosphaerae TaxID=1872709 RepID=UPI000E3B61E1|nr:hypothetical protein [Allorhizocola rhizosphaerae]